jgi:hypothetical protein
MSLHLHGASRLTTAPCALQQAAEDRTQRGAIFGIGWGVARSQPSRYPSVYIRYAHDSVVLLWTLGAHIVWVPEGLGLFRISITSNILVAL